MKYPMTIEQTVEIPANHRLTIEVPQEVPAGPVVLTYRPKSAQEADNPYEAVERLEGLARKMGSTLTVDRFLEMSREDEALDEAEYRRMFGKGGTE
jgi:hypothetical protein